MSILPTALHLQVLPESAVKLRGSRLALSNQFMREASLRQGCVRVADGRTGKSWECELGGGVGHQWLSGWDAVVVGMDLKLGQKVLIKACSPTELCTAPPNAGRVPPVRPAAS